MTFGLNWGLGSGIRIGDWDWGLGLGLEIGDWDWTFAELFRLIYLQLGVR